MKVLTITYFLNDQKIVQIIQRDFFYAVRVIEKLLNIDFDQLILIVARNKDQYDNFLKTNRPSWGVTTQKKGVVYLYDPSLWKKNITGHNMKDLKPSLIHELVHLYMFKKHMISPEWFKEGLAVRISDENKGNKKKMFNRLVLKYPIPNIITATSSFKKMKGKLPLMYYLTSFMFVSYLFELLGIKKTARFIKLLENKSNFENQFSKVFSLSLQEVWLKFKKEM